jgi:hypothetical protein
VGGQFPIWKQYTHERLYNGRWGDRPTGETSIFSAPGFSRFMTGLRFLGNRYRNAINLHNYIAMAVLCIVIVRYMFLTADYRKKAAHGMKNRKRTAAFAAIPARPYVSENSLETPYRTFYRHSHAILLVRFVNRGVYKLHLDIIITIGDMLW